MFSHNGRISVRQVELFLIVQMFNTSLLLSPKIAGMFVGRNGYILPLIAILLGLVYIYCISLLTKSFPEDTMVEFLPKIVPSFIGYIILILFAIKILVGTGLELRMLGEIIAQVMLPKTPLPVIILVMLLTVTYLVKSGIEATGRMAEIMLYFVFIPLFVVFLIVLLRADYRELMPFFQMNARGVIQGTFWISLIFMPLEYMLMMTGVMRKPHLATRAMVVSVVVVGVLDAIIILLTYAGVGFSVVGTQVWPVLTLMQSIQHTGSVIENHEALMMTGWIFSIYMYISAGVYFSSLVGSRSFKFDRENVFVLPLVPIIYFVAMYPTNLVQVYRYYEYYERYLSVWFLLPIPLILLLIAKGRRVGSKGE